MSKLSKAPVLKHFYKVFKAPLGDEDSNDFSNDPLVEFDPEFLRNLRQLGNSIGNPGIRVAG